MILQLGTLFLLGAVFGSFINMLVYRMHKGESITGRSYCDNTKESLGALDLIPIISYLLYRGKCRKCGVRLPLLYPLVELISGLLFVVVFVQVDKLALSAAEQILNYVVFSAFGLALLFFAVYDYLYWEVEVYAAIAVLVFGLIMLTVNLFVPIVMFSTPANHIFGMLAGALLIWLLVKMTGGAGMGEGDIYLFAILGLTVGLKDLFWAFMFTVCSGAITGVILAMKTRKLRGTLIQFAPFISLSAILFVLFRLEINTLIFNALLKLSDFYLLFYGI